MKHQIKKQIFIGGCQRSGTTLLGAMLGAHSDCVCTPESQFKIDVFRTYDWARGQVDLLAGLDVIKNHWRFKLWGIDIESDSVSKKELNATYPGLLGWNVKRYAESIGKATASIWVDHTPDNIRYATTLCELFPQAKIIHIVRDGRAVASSIMQLDWGPNTIIGAARWWIVQMPYGLGAEASLAKDQIIRVRYEDLVCEPESTLRRLCTYLDLDYQPEMAKSGGFKPPRYTAKQHALVGKKPNTERVTAWERELTSRQIEIFEWLTGDLLHYLGYPLKYGLRARGPTRLERQRSRVRELYQNVINRCRHRLCR